jgi:hypothetical protein
MTMTKVGVAGFLLALTTGTVATAGDGRSELIMGGSWVEGKLPLS